MKPLLTAIIALLLLSCSDSRTQTTKEKTIKVDSPTVAPSSDYLPDSAEMLQKLQNYVYDTTIYDQYLPADVKNFLFTHLPEWKLPHPGEWDALWFQTYKTPNSLVNFISGDFNCDGEKDYALLLTNKVDASLAAWIIQSGPDGYTGIKLEDYDKQENHIQLGLELIPPGSLNYMDLDSDEEQVLKLECSAVQVSYFEKGATTYYWNKDQYSSVVTGD